MISERLTRRGSISQQFVKYEIKDFNAIYRNAIYSLLVRVATGENKIFSCMFSSIAFRNSSLYSRWCKFLLGIGRDPTDFIETFVHELFTCLIKLLSLFLGCSQNWFVYRR